MSVSKRRDSPYYRYNFIVQGHRFSGSTKCTSKRDAEAVERAKRIEAKAIVKAGAFGKDAPMTLDAACGRYWDEVGQFSSDSAQVWRSCLWLTRHLPPNMPIQDIKNDDVARLVSIRRLEPVENVMRAKKVAKGGACGPAKRLAPATVNRSVTQPLRRILKRASELWGEQVTPIRWRDHTLGEPKERVRYMTEEEESAVFAVLPENYKQLVTFAFLAGCRASECVRLTWGDIEWGELRVRIVGKGYKGNAKLRHVPLTPEMRDDLWTMQPDGARLDAAIFRNVAGQPVTYRSYYAAFRTACRRAGIKDLKVHDLRHIAATRILRAQGSNLRMAQLLLGHSDISTTAKYAHVLDEDLRAAMRAMAQNPHRSATPAPAKSLKSR